MSRGSSTPSPRTDRKATRYQTPASTRAAHSDQLNPSDKGSVAYSEEIGDSASNTSRSDPDRDERSAFMLTATMLGLHARGDEELGLRASAVFCPHETARPDEVSYRLQILRNEISSSKEGNPLANRMEDPPRATAERSEPPHLDGLGG